MSKADDLSPRQLADAAHHLGLYPPNFDGGSNPPIALISPGDTGYDGTEPILIWNICDDVPDDFDPQLPLRRI
ncbi:hypothetical protein AB0I28_33410 [Phytomonospora sp. NPDC050363]|uniref:hypothetical protein n=1 Tax=Phytomonospora sp. NPDC050363 TaxID=3155642 RepID=UPI0033FC7D59